jgi:hypothetical protein
MSSSNMLSLSFFSSSSTIFSFLFPFINLAAFLLAFIGIFAFGGGGFEEADRGSRGSLGAAFFQ